MNKLKKLLLGKPLKNDEITHQKLSKLWGLPIMASDAVSSVAYAIEEILIVLVPVAGLLAFKYIPYITISILALLLILVVSYSQIIDHYPSGGGAYAVAKENLGKTASLIVSSALIIDYIMTVAVSISSSTEALVSAFPIIVNHKVIISLLCIFVITFVNLRGIREASNIFGIPTYIFIFSMIALIVVGGIKILTGNLNSIVYEQSNVLPFETVKGIGILLLLRAFSSGCAAMTGVEAVSNAISSFKEPSQKNAKLILFMLAGIIIFIVGGTSILAINLKVAPALGHTVLSQMSMAVFGKSFMYYVIQIFTSIILILAANTAYNGLPQLLYILAHDGYVPRQFSSRGTRLSFSNGIMFICIISSLLIILFRSDTHRLIPLYSVGVFISFTLAQYGMFKKWRVIKTNGWQYKMCINLLGSAITLIVSIIVFCTKFIYGAWILAVVIPILMLLMILIKKHYSFVAKQLSLEEFHPIYEGEKKIKSTKCIILIHDINKPFLKSLNYASSISEDIIALHICRHKEHAEELRRQWEELKIPIELVIIETPYRDIIKPLDEYLWQEEDRLQSGESISVISVKFVTTHWFDTVLHNQTTYFLEKHLSKHKNVSTIILPFHYKWRKKSI